jgi:hypothetical protein
VSRPEDGAKPFAPNTLHDQAVPNTLRSPSRPSGRHDTRDEPADGVEAVGEDEAVEPAPPPFGQPSWTALDLERFESDRRRAAGASVSASHETRDPTEAEPTTPDMASDKTLTAETAARDLADLARRFEAASLSAEAALVRAFQREARDLTGQTGRLELTESDDERLSIDAAGAIAADVIPEDAGGAWRHLATPEELVEFYDPADLFDDLSDALARAGPSETPQTPEAAAAQLEGLVSRFRGRVGKGSDPNPFVEARLLEDFEEAAQPLAHRLGEILLVDGSDERITLEGDGHFRAAVVPDDADGSWKTLRTADELVEYYSPAELLERLVARLRSAYPAAAPETAAVAIQLLADLARRFAERSRAREIDLLNEFELRAAGLTGVIGELIVVVDDDDERLVLGSNGHFAGSIVPKDRPGTWESLDWPDELVQFYDPADMFADLADALIEAYPSAADAAAPQKTPAPPASQS